jgi:hypothetical protein
LRRGRRRHPARATLEFLDARCIRSVEAYGHLGLETSAGAMLLFGDDGSPAEVHRRVSAMADSMREHGAASVQVATAAAESDALLAARRCALPALARLGGATMLEDVGVPRSRLPSWSAVSTPSPNGTQSPSRPSVTPATGTRTRPDASTRPTLGSGLVSRPPSATSSPPPWNWAAPSPASMASARRSFPSSRRSSAAPRPPCWPGLSGRSTR